MKFPLTAGRPLRLVVLDRIGLMKSQQGPAIPPDALLSLVAHELRTLLTVISGYLDMIQSGDLVEDARADALRVVTAKAGEAGAMVDMLLTASRLEAGALPLAPVDFNVTETVRLAVSSVRARADLEGATIDVALPHQPTMVRADRSHVAGILANLLNNALTYSPHPARVTVEIRPGDPVEIAVHDRGVGIAPEEQQSIFERFRRLDGATPRFTPGLGLGLSISRELAELNHGCLVLEHSAPGEGSVFVLQLLTP